MARDSAMSVTLSIDALDRDVDQQRQIEDLVFKFERLLIKRRGLVTGAKWRRDINRFLKTPGTTYEQIRARLEGDFNLELTLTRNELMQIISP